MVTKLTPDARLRLSVAVNMINAEPRFNIENSQTNELQIYCFFVHENGQYLLLGSVNLTPACEYLVGRASQELAVLCS